MLLINPTKVFRKFDGQKKDKVAQLDYRKEYNNYHLGAFIKRSSWSPSNDMLGFILEIGWGTFYQMVVLDIKTGKIELIDNNIYDFDWYPQENKLMLVKQLEPHSLNTMAMVYDPEMNQSRELSIGTKNINGIAFDKRANLYVAEVESKQVFRIDLKWLSNKKTPAYRKMAGK
ncbi:MAG: hypothetical protein PWQ97_884 [Tepidanaerobacteraceae bacterium]|nr:hypothetical protein [Tepidanaerobacteraceae bacterium]